jgi:hypothetical protein
LSKPKGSWTTAIISSGLIGAIVVISIFGYNTWYNVPNMTYEILPAYPISTNEQVSAVVVRNEGRAGATNIRIVIHGAGDISVLSLSSGEQTNTAQNATTLTVTLPRLPAGSQVSLYAKVESSYNPPITSVYVSSDQGIGNQRATTSTSPIELILLLMPLVTALMTTLILLLYIRIRRLSV